MEFNEKMQKLRADKNLTQEELAEKLFVSRTAISKWESGRGYPSIDSLKAIAEFFHVTIDDLIGGAEMVTLAEQDKKESGRKTTALICGILDSLAVLLFVLPVFGNGGTGSVSSVALPSLTQISLWLKIAFIAVTGLTAANGFCAVVISNFGKPEWDKHRLVTGMVLSVIGTILFILARQPYAGVFSLCLLVTKGFLMLKRK